MMEDTMAHTAPLPKREAIVQLRHVVLGVVGPWRNAIDIDPIALPVELDGMADVFDAGLMDLMDVLVANDETLTAHGEREDRLVWSDDESTVRGVCPLCDDVFVVNDGYPDDLHNGGCAVVCSECVTG